ncbi:MAG TPA: ABC transporter ATP-binding protein [Anaerolineae bacterium]|nr:ABC transporter ATP-binding protein [Anaerolineae bacterium]
MSQTEAYKSVWDLSWPLLQLGEGLEWLARALKWQKPDVVLPPLAEEAQTWDDETLTYWLDTASAQLALTATPRRLLYPNVIPFLEMGAPLILMLEQGGERRFLLVSDSNSRYVTVMGPDYKRHRIGMKLVAAAVTAPLTTPLAAEIEDMLATAAVPPRRQETVRQSLLRERLSNEVVTGVWLWEPGAEAPLRQHLSHIHFFRRLLTFTSAHALQYSLWLLSWGILGRAVFEGRVADGWLWAWALLLVTIVPLRMWVRWYQGVSIISLGGILHRRLLHGAMQLRPDEVRHMGAGQLMGRAFEVEQVEALTLTGGMAAVMAVVELFLSLLVLMAGVQPRLFVGLWVFWLGWTSWRAYSFYVTHDVWTIKRRELTNDVIEKMVGHRTRLAQMDPDMWHTQEDNDLSHYVSLSGRSDKDEVAIRVWVSRGWVVAATAALAPAFISGEAESAAIAITLGGILSAHLAFRKMAQGMAGIVMAIISWTQIGLLLKAADRPDPKQVLTTIGGLKEAGVAEDETVLTAYNLTFRHQEGGRTILQDCDVQINRGDRILLEGPSGGGKSTLISLLTGIREPQQGLILLRGLDQATLGRPGWRRHIVAAPQFHENHVLGATFLFNLLLGRSWPPKREDWRLAHEICEELGLGKLLREMPAGMLQMVGDMGWQLSHGEKSRLYIARALLQKADIVVLDESFAALDPESLQKAMACVQKYAPSLVVITHP